MKIVLVNGAFDILHKGHIDLLKYAKSLGDYLLVGIDDDARIKYNKGLDRPFNKCENRKYLLESIRWVDEVRVFSSDEELISMFELADVRVIGSDWKGKEIVGSKLIPIVFFERVNEESTTKLIEDYLNKL